MSDNLSDNPYAAPTVEVTVAEPTDAESIRGKYLPHEASVRSIGWLYLLGAANFTLAGCMAGISAFSIGPFDWVSLVISGVYLGLAIPTAIVGVAVRRLRPWARTAATVLSGIGLLLVPIGTVINGYCLYLLLSAKGKFVFSEEYRRVVEQTPHMKYRSSFLVLLLLVIVVIVVVAYVSIRAAGL